MSGMVLKRIGFLLPRSMQAKCGELVQIYYSLGGNTLRQQRHRVKTVTWNIEENKPVLAAPCGDPAAKTCGCDLIVEKQPMTYMDTNLKPETYVLIELAGGTPDITQKSLCGSS